MNMSDIQVVYLILIMAAGTMITRFLPFLLFPGHRKTPRFVLYLGRVLPPAVIGLLVIYCLKDISLIRSPYALPELLAIGLIILLQRLKKNALLSIAAGTASYMLLLQIVF